MKRPSRHCLLLLFPRQFREEYKEEWKALAERRSFSHVFFDTLKAAPPLWRQALRTALSRRGKPILARGAFAQDVRFGLRTLTRRPSFALIGIGTLGVGIGATTAMFSVVEGVLLRPLPYRHPQALVTVWETFPEWRENPPLAAGWDRITLAWPDFERWRNHQTTFEGVAIYGFATMNLVGPHGPERTAVGQASSSLFRVLGIDPVMGRGFIPGEDGQGAPPVALVSYSMWQERYGSDPELLGESIHIDDGEFTIVGVLPKGFRVRKLGPFAHSGKASIWIPVGAAGTRLRAGDHRWDAVARLKSGASLAEAVSETETLLRGDLTPDEMGVRILPRAQEETEGFSTPLYLLFAGSALLLLIACGNVAILLSGEVTNRRREMAARVAVGARATRLVRQLLTESVLLGLAGGALGVLVAHLGTRGLLALAPALPRIEDVGVNSAALFFAGGVGVLTGLIFGLTPSLDLLRVPPHELLRSGSRSGQRDLLRFQQGLMAIQISMTMILLTSGGLVARSLSELFAVDPGFKVGELSMARVSLPRYHYPDPTDQKTQVMAMRDALAGIPGVVAVSGTSSLPFHGSPNLLSFGIQGEPDPPNGARHTSWRRVLPGFFETMGIPILAGRALSDSDQGVRPREAVISESLARSHWQGRSPLGARILFGDTLTVVGIAADVIHESPDADPLPTLYSSFLQEPMSSVSFVVRSADPPEHFVQMLKGAIRTVAPQVPIPHISTLSSLEIGTLREERFRTVLLLVFAACAAVLSGAGVFGITSRNAARRTRELAIRKALGANTAGLIRIAMRATARAGIVGVLVGLLGSLAVARLLHGLLFGVEAWDPLVYGASAFLLMILGLASSFQPAHRAGSVPPMEILRDV